MSELAQLRMLQQLADPGGFSGSESWLWVAWLVILAAAIFWRPEAIGSPTLLRWSCTLFALSVLLPPALYVGLQFFMQLDRPGRMPGSSPSTAAFFLQLTTALRPLLFGCSLMLGFAALAPRPKRSPAAPEPPGPFD